ncbi:polyphosphate kinase 2 [Novosphingobium sp.]|uniref:polyphosphate kinase 2 n=1 Tax=Novosphingobium sp. TaxID=1874826 RepID=UPI003B51F910
MSHLHHKAYDTLIEPLQEQLTGAARWAAKTGARVVVLFEGRDTAGKSGAIHAISEKLDTHQVRTVALGKPTSREESQWYFQRYIAHLPAAGEIALFDRSWYNRAGVEAVMGFATKDQVHRFLEQAPVFERMLIDEGILLFKYWLCCDQEEQEKRFAERAENPFKRWKLSPVDLASRDKYDDYTKARETMLTATHTPQAPWTLVDFNDQRRGRLTLIRDFLDRLPDTDVKVPELKLPKLHHHADKERYGVLSPIPPFADDD